jgi:anaerobic selenocysteine-containing dehydrogenase
VTTENGKLVKLEGDPHHPITQGTLCSAMDGYLDDVVRNPDRLLYPLRRTGRKGEGKFERVSWDEALGEVAGRLRKIIEEYGGSAVLPYHYAGTEGLVQMNALGGRFFARLGATRLVAKVCGATAESGVSVSTGAPDGVLMEDLVHSRAIVFWGTNPALSNPHGWRFVEEAKRQGARLITIDPQRTATAAASHVHLRPIPGTDAALALAMMHVIVRDGLHDADYIEKYTLGFAELKHRIAEYPPDKVAEITGLRAEDIEDLARTYATTQPAVIRLLIGMEHRANGSGTFRAISCLPALTGAWKHRGGGICQFSFTVFPLNFDAVDMPQLEDQKIRSVNMVQLGKALTDSSMSPAIQALVVYNTNPATIAPNQNLVRQGLAREDLFTVVLEHFLTDTARYADYVFPAATQVEVLDLLTSWGQTYLALNKPAVAPAGEAVSNSDFFRRLAARMGLQEAYLQETDEQIIRAALKSDHPFLQGISYERLEREGWVRMNIPEPWIPFEKGGFKTPSGKCEFYSQGLKDQGFDPLPRYDPVPAKTESRYPLRLLSSKDSKYFVNSSNAGIQRLITANGEPKIKLHPDDAAKRRIASGDLVRVFNERGEMKIKAAVTDSVIPGLVAVCHGWWGSRLPGGSSTNALTPDGLADRGEGGDFHDAWAEVEKV